MSSNGKRQDSGPGRPLRSRIDTCAPKAAHFGVPEKNVFR